MFRITPYAMSKVDEAGIGPRRVNLDSPVKGVKYDKSPSNETHPFLDMNRSPIMTSLIDAFARIKHKIDMMGLSKEEKEFIEKRMANAKDYMGRSINLVASRRVHEAVVDESVEDEHHHLQCAHDALSSKIANCKRRGEKCDSLEAKLKTIASLIGKKD